MISERLYVLNVRYISTKIEKRRQSIGKRLLISQQTTITKRSIKSDPSDIDHPSQPYKRHNPLEIENLLLRKA